MFNNCKCKNNETKAINKLVYPKPSVTADIVISRRNKKTEQFLFIVRKNEPFKGKLAFPGGFLNENETGIEGAIRELKEETGLSLLPSQLYLHHVADEKGRDPRGWTISLVYKYNSILTMEDSAYLKANDDAKELKWVNRAFIIRNPKLFAFDHAEIMKKVY